MANAKEWLEFGQMFHGHKCPAMPNGLRAGAAAMNKLGVKRTGDGALHAIVEIGSNHCGTCYALRPHQTREKGLYGLCRKTLMIN